MPAKKLPKWAIPVGAVALGGGYLLYKKKKKDEESVKQGEVNPYLAQSFIPVTAENVAGVGAVRGVGGEENNTALLDAQKENEQLIFSLLENQQQASREREAANFEFIKALRETTTSVTGGGAPTGGAATGTVVATTTGGSSPVTNTPQGGCPSDFPLYNPAPGKGCYRISRHKSPGGCICHGYKNGKLECQQGKASNGSCHW